MLYIWNKAGWQALQRLRQKLPHAVLLQAGEGTGAFDLAREFAQGILCETPRAEGFPCGHCRACGWFRLGNHPDFRLVQPESMAAEAEEVEEGAKKEKRSDQIRIDQVRALQDFLAVGTHRAGLRIILVHPAEAMNFNTQNALLKNLEEPPAGTLFLLVTCHLDRLLPTVQSRCLKVALPAPDRALSLEWLRQQGVENPAELLAAAGNAPLGAQALAVSEPERRRFVEALASRDFSPIVLAAQMQRTALVDVVTWLQRWCYDLLASRLGSGIRYHPSHETLIAGISGRCRASAIAGFLRELAVARSLAPHPLNSKLFVEDLLLRYRTLTTAV
jgi:DNA polymerase-3 subunit delta'